MSPTNGLRRQPARPKLGTRANTSTDIAIKQEDQSMEDDDAMGSDDEMDTSKGGLGLSTQE